MGSRPENPRFDVETVSKALGVDCSGGSGSEQVDKLAAFFQGLLNEAEGSLLMLCARIGVQDTGEQVALRERVRGNDQLQSMLEQAQNVVPEGGFLSGTSSAGPADAILVSALYSLFALLFKPEDRASFPKLTAWFKRCIAGLSGLMGGDHMLGMERIGKQIDVRADSAYVRANADFNNAINYKVKKKKTQRQLEKEAKGKAKAMELPPAASSFQFTEKVSADASNESKVAAVRAALAQVGAKPGQEVLYHPAAHTMAEMPAELRTKGGFVCKNLFLKAKKARKGVENDSLLWLISVPENAQVNLKSLSKSLGYKDELRQTKPEVLLETMGIKPGGVSPFGLINDSECKVNVILDATMMHSADNLLFFHPLTNEASMGITAEDLAKLVSASARVPKLVAFDHKEEGAGKKGEDAGQTPTKAPEAAPAAAAPPLELSHEDAQARLWARLKAAGVEPYKEKDPDLAAKRPIGHSSHNLFVKDKKTKALYMVSTRQEVDVNLKQIAKMVGAKELRFSSDAKSAFCHDKGCLTLLSLYNNVQGNVTPVIDSELMKLPSIRVCAGCNDPLDHSQHNVVDIKPSLLLELWKESNTPEPKLIDLE